MSDTAEKRTGAEAEAGARAAEKYYVAVDIGASSGRVLTGRVTDGLMSYDEVFRFDNTQVLSDGHSCWDIEGLYEYVVEGLAAAGEKEGRAPVSISIDTWGVDFVLLDAEDRILGDAVAYRDGRTDGIFEVADKIMDPAEVYARTGIQRQPFNTLYQLLALGREHPEQLEAARTFLMIPDYLVWRLTGEKTNEYTNASTTGMLDARTCDWDQELLAAFGIPAGIFLEPSMPGTVAGGLLPEVAEKVGYDAPVILCASHDTGSAYLSVPARDDQAAYLSSGTWSLLGCELAEPVCDAAAREQNFTNEGGYQRRYRFLKNIMGLWMNQSVRREVNGVDYVEGKTSHKAMLDHQIGFGELIELTRAAEPFSAYVDVDDERFLSPDSMYEEVRAACADAGQPVPATIGEVMRTVYCSLTASYARAVANLGALTGREYTSINIVGGGCQDDYLNQMTADACGLPVFAGPIEGTCIGNFVVQMIADDVFPDLATARGCISKSFDIRCFEPLK